MPSEAQVSVSDEGSTEICEIEHVGNVARTQHFAISTKFYMLYYFIMNVFNGVREDTIFSRIISQKA